MRTIGRALDLRAFAGHHAHAANARRFSQEIRRNADSPTAISFFVTYQRCETSAVPIRAAPARIYYLSTRIRRYGLRLRR